MTVRARALPGGDDPVAHDLDDVLGSGVAMDPDLDLAPERVELVHGGGPVHVGRHQERRLLLQLQPLGELARRGRLARALQSHQQDDGRRHRGVGDGRLLLAQQDDQLVVDDLDQLMPGPDFLERGETHGLGLHPLQKIPGQIEAHVGLEQDPPDLPEPFL